MIALSMAIAVGAVAAPRIIEMGIQHRRVNEVG